MTVPELSNGPPAAGKRVKQTNPGYEGWDLFHTLYLPTDWLVAIATSDLRQAVYRLQTSYASLELATGTLDGNSPVVKQ